MSRFNFLFYQQLRRVHFFPKKHNSESSKHLTNIFDKKKQEFDLELEHLEKRIEDLEEYRRKTDFFIKKSYQNVVDEIYKRRNEIEKKIHDHYLVLMEKIIKHKEDKKNKFNQMAEQIDAFQIHVDKFDEKLSLDDKFELFKKNLGDIKSKDKLVESAINDLTREDFTFKYSDLSMNQIFGELLESKKKKELVEVNNIFRDNSLDENVSHRDEINDLILTNDSKLLSASKDGSVKLWDTATKTCRRKFIVFDHLNSITCLCVLSNGILATGSFDKKIRLWNIKNGECIKSINAHSDSVTCLKLLKSGLMVSGSSDCTLKLWNHLSGECSVIFRGHSNSINCLEETEDEKILSGSSDCQIRLWNQSGKCLKVLKNHHDYVLCIKVLENNKLASGSKDKTVKIWNVESGECEKTLKGHMEPVSCIWPLKNDKIMSGSWDGTIKIWDLASGTSIKTIKVHQNQINCLQVDLNGNIFTGSSDKTIKKIHYEA